ncbi:hypothetical protein [Saccharicrinis fermentans]|uniref:hypothetical protein n=1 Tax=Saccharicrinis fermentans TaxID=982 RepID=UPI0012B64881|nr:hypothetical protein [Saccharicrinis fermentans]
MKEDNLILLIHTLLLLLIDMFFLSLPQKEPKKSRTIDRYLPGISFPFRPAHTSFALGQPHYHLKCAQENFSPTPAPGLLFWPTLRSFTDCWVFKWGLFMH